MSRLRTLASVLAAVLGSVGLLASGLALASQFSAQLDVLTHLAPGYLVVAILALILAAASAARGRPVLLGVAALALGASIWLLAPEVVGRGAEPRAPAAATGRIKIVQFNALAGENRDTARAAAWLLAQDADVVLMQEPGDVMAPLLRAGYHMTCRACGAVVFTRARPVRIFAVPGRRGHASPLAASTLRDAAGEFTVVSVHRPWPTRILENRVQQRELVRLLARHPRDRVIVGGDFNSTPWSSALRREDRALGLIRRTRLLPTWPAATVSHNRLPAAFPYLPIDHVYAGAGWATVKVERGPQLGSDHFPVVVTLAPVAQPAAK